MDGLTNGRIVHYVIGEYDALEINRRRSTGAATHSDEWPKGAQAHVGNSVSIGEHLPMIIVNVWNDDGLVNGQVFLDGNDVLWATSKEYDENGRDGTWHWIEKV